MDQKNQRVFLFLRLLEIQTDVYSALPPSFFYQDVNQLPFTTERSCFYMSFSFYIETGTLVGRK